MLLDARQFDADTVISTDLCIVGAGAAGITLAMELKDSGLDIVLLESGGFDSEDAPQDLYAGEATGTLLRTRPAYLSQSRLRYFGGTTNHWAGWCRPLDPWDFEAREWVERSGWPFSRTHLDPFYDRAAEFCQISSFRSGDESALLEERRALQVGQGEWFETKMFYLSPPTRFGEVYREALHGSDRVRTILFSNVTNITSNADATHVEALDVRTLGGKQFHVQPRMCVLAAGAIENARLLLCSAEVVSAGLGNQHDTVGRCFVDHPHIKSGFLTIHPQSEAERARVMTEAFTAAYDEVTGPPIEAHRAVGLLCTTEQVQREHKLLNFTATVHRRPYDRLTPSQAAIADLGLAVDIPELRPQTNSRSALAYLGLLARVEQEPNPSNRVALRDERDELGMRTAKLTWNVSEKDRDSLERTMKLLGQVLGQYGQGRAQSLLHDDAVWRTGSGGSHHVGTLRMHTDPHAGVVTPDCQVHGVDNLYVAGSGVFPTSGAANPTFTIVALALRLADHLRSQSAGVGRGA